jgi:PhnB protein
MSKIPEGFTTVTPGLIINGAADAIELYKDALGAEEIYRMDDDNGKIMHACILIGNSNVFISDTSEKMDCADPSKSSFYLYLDDVDSAYSRATQAGMKGLHEVRDMFWGDRTGTVVDRFGNHWTLATHMREVSPQEMAEGKKQFVKEMEKKKAA